MIGALVVCKSAVQSFVTLAPVAPIEPVKVKLFVPRARAVAPLPPIVNVFAE